MGNQTPETPIPQLEKWARATLAHYDEIHEGIHEHLEAMGSLALAARDLTNSLEPASLDICIFHVTIVKDTVTVYGLAKIDDNTEPKKFKRLFTLDKVREYFHNYNDEDYQDIKVSVSPTFSALNSNHQTSSGEDPRMPNYKYDDWGWKRRRED